MNLVDAAVVLGRPDIAGEAAAAILSEAPDGRHDLGLARFVLENRAAAKRGADTEISRDARHRRIAAARRSLRAYPRNPILLVDLALDYASLGQIIQAERAIRLAIALAPENRFVLRSASRFFLHIHQPEFAHRILSRAEGTRFDPWLLAAEIATSSVAGHDSRLLTRARGFLEDASFPPQHTTELASALGTVEHSHGNRRLVRRFFTHALLAPTDNTVAQAAWISRHMPAFEVPTNDLGIPLAFEARAWTAAVEGRFKEAVALAWDWLRDEPFGTGAALFGSWVSVTALDDTATAIRLVSEARVANPDEPRLIAQEAYCRSLQNELDAAEQLLTEELPTAIDRHPDVRSVEMWNVIRAADRGLIAFRRGKSDAGREAYASAISSAKKIGAPGLRAVAYLNLFREELRFGGVTAQHKVELQKALNDLQGGQQAAYREFVRRLLTLAP
jgi:tetratricopeptide (TPR) repeat protein